MDNAPFSRQKIVFLNCAGVCKKKMDGCCCFTVKMLGDVQQKKVGSV